MSNPQTKFLQRHLRRGLVVLFSWGLLCFGGCPKTTQKPDAVASKRDLAARAQMFNKFLRWRTYARAKMMVLPKLRSDYMMKWEKERGLVKIAEFAIRDVTILEENKKALVLIVQNHYRLPSVTLEKRVFQQQWEVQGNVWYYIGDKKGKPVLSKD